MSKFRGYILKKFIFIFCPIIAGILCGISLTMASFTGSDGYYINSLAKANKLSFDYKDGNNQVKTVTLNLDGTSSDMGFKGLTLYTVLQKEVLGDVSVSSYRTMRTKGKSFYINFVGDAVFELSFDNGVLKEVVKTTYTDDKSSINRVEKFSNFNILN